MKLTQTVTEQSSSDIVDIQAQDMEEVPDFNTIFYDKEIKRVVQRTKKKVETGGREDEADPNSDRTVSLCHIRHSDPGRGEP